MMVVDLETLEVLASNEACTRCSGYAASEIRGRNLADLLVPEDRTRYARLLAERTAIVHVLEGRSAWTLRHRDGTPLRAEVSREPILFQGHPAIVLYQAPAREIGAQELARTGTDPTEFAFAALHDLKEPLHLVKGYLALLWQRESDRLPSESREFLEYAFVGAQRMQAVVVNLLEYFRADAKGLSPEPTNLETVVSEAMDALRLQIQEAGATVTKDPLPTVFADRVQLGRVFQNLLSNAVKFHADRPPAIHIGAVAVPAGWEFYVRDNGIGVAPADAQRILQPFQRLHSSDKYPGTGLGLSICRKIVELHGGTIWIQSAPEGGTVVHFTLPQRGST